MSIFPAGYLNSHKDDADNTIDSEWYMTKSLYEYLLVFPVFNQTFLFNEDSE